MQKKINIYIAYNFLLRFSQVSLGFSLLIFFINFLDVIEKIKGSEASFGVAIFMSSLQIPDFLNDIAPSLVLMSAIVTFFLLSSKSEITIIRASGFSLWQILQPIALSAFLLGVFWITIFNSFSIQALNKFNQLENQYVKKEERFSIEPKNGIWLKQYNFDKSDEIIIIQAGKIYKNSLQLDEIIFWFFDKNNNFYQKIDAEKMILVDNTWHLEKVTLNDQNHINKKIDNYEIMTNLKPDFIMQKVFNNFQNVKLFSIFNLPNLIEELKNSGFSPTKFIVYFNSLLSKPILFVAMILIACFFGLNHTRNSYAVLMIFLGITFGLLLYIISSIMIALSSSNLVPTFAATWVIAIICLAIGVLLIYKKETI